MTRRITIYKRAKVGYGCLETSIVVDSENFISETDDTITIAEVDLDHWSGMVETDITYFKSLKAFIAHEKAKYAAKINELKNRHEKTMEMANRLLRVDKEKKPDMMIPF